MACETRKKVYAIDVELGKAVDAKIDSKCEHIIKPIALVFRTKSERATRMYKDRIETIVREAVPQTPNPTKTVPVKLTRISKRTHPDGTVEEVTEIFEGPAATAMWERSQKKQKTQENAIGS